MSRCWTVEFRFSQEIRWLIVLLFSTGCAWFIRLLVIGFIPYAGFEGLPDLERQFLSESLVAASWVFLGIQLLFWENSEIVQNRKNSILSPLTSEENPSNGARYRNIILGSAALFLVFLLPHIKWPVDTSAITRALLQLPGLITLSGHAGSLLAQDFLVFSLTRCWSRRKNLNLWYPALCYAFLRGWYPVHLSSFILLLVMGRVLCGMVGSLRSFLLPMLVDCFCMLPALIGLAGTWIPLFPAGPFLPAAGGPSWWWAIVILPILWVFPSPQNSGKKHDLV